ncbi:MAG: glucokinase [Burkholderiales bacterium]|nr:glucokinase [Burkholderiales bacterium]
MATPRFTRLVADIGGTNARFALLAEGSETPQQESTLQCADFPDLGAAAARYLQAQGTPPVQEAAVAVATPITGDRIKLTNNDWSFSIEQTRKMLELDRLVLVNDFTALALSLPLLGADEYRQVGGSLPVARTPIALIGAGTGLGVSGLVPAGESWIPIQGEGGHTAFSPVTPRETEVLKVMWRSYDHVSTERLASGPGLVALRDALCTIDGAAPPALTPEEIARRGMNGAEPVCVEALEMFCGILGSAAANLCVTLGARGGVFIGGGIVPSLGSWFDQSPFRARFEQKGRFRTYVAAVPTYVITARNPALRGVARAFS